MIDGSRSNFALSRFHMARFAVAASGLFWARLSPRGEKGQVFPHHGRGGQRGDFRDIIGG